MASCILDLQPQLHFRNPLRTHSSAKRQKYSYDGWNLIARLELSVPTDPASAPRLVQTYVWGNDLSNTPQGAGGVGGLLFIHDYSADASGTYFVSYDGNGNVVLLTKSTDGTRAATYEYDPFGNEIRHSGLPIPNSAFSLADRNPFRFSTKFIDDETALVYYGYRYYSPTMGRWINRDPSEERGGLNLYDMVRNDVVNAADILGLWSTDVHHLMVDEWFKKRALPKTCKCCRGIDPSQVMKDASNKMDGLKPDGTPGDNFVDAQSPANAYRHAMRGSFQSVGDAERKYNKFLDDEEKEARDAALDAMTNSRSAVQRCDSIHRALQRLGNAFHALSDSHSPVHRGFQPWPYAMSGHGSSPFSEEDLPDYKRLKEKGKDNTVDDLDKRFGPLLDGIVKMCQEP